jgi:hypothetical protein
MNTDYLNMPRKARSQWKIFNKLDFVVSGLWEAYENNTYARWDAAQLFFLRCLSVGWNWHSPGQRRGGKCRMAASPKLFTFREAGTQVPPVTMSRPSRRTAAPPCLPLGIKDSLKEDTLGLLLWGFCFGLLGFWLFDVGGLLEGKRIAEGKRNAEGKINCWRESAGGRLLKGENELKGGLLKGKELLKENC